MQVTLLLVILLLWILCHTQEKPLKRLNQNLKKLSQAEGKKWHVGVCNETVLDENGNRKLKVLIPSAHYKFLVSKI